MNDQPRDPGPDDPGNGQPAAGTGQQSLWTGTLRPPPLPPRPKPPEPFTEPELRQALALPHRALDLVLGDRGRMAATMLDHDRLMPLLLLLILGGVVFALPYGFLAPNSGFAKIAILFTGSVLICFPSLHVFSRYLGFDLDFLQNLARSLLISAAAAMVSFGFAPIIWFIGATGGPGDDDLAFTAGISVLLLVVALLMGMGHMLRCLFASPAAWRQKFLQLSLTLMWFVLLVFINYRMALHLGILTWSE